MVTGLYGPQEDRAKLQFLEELRGIKNINNLPWLLLGDFNLLRSTQDTTGDNWNLGTILEFNRFINDMC